MDRRDSRSLLQRALDVVEQLARRGRARVRVLPHEVAQASQAFREKLDHAPRIRRIDLGPRSSESEQVDAPLSLMTLMLEARTDECFRCPPREMQRFADGNTPANHLAHHERRFVE